MEKTNCQYCDWQPGQEHHNKCPEKARDPEVRKLAVEVWRIGYADAVFGMDKYWPEDSYHALGYSRGQKEIQNVKTLDLDQIKPVNFDDKVIDDLFAGL